MIIRKKPRSDCSVRFWWDRSTKDRLTLFLWWGRWSRHVLVRVHPLRVAHRQVRVESLTTSRNLLMGVWSLFYASCASIFAGHGVSPQVFLFLNEELLTLATSRTSSRKYRMASPSLLSRTCVRAGVGITPNIVVVTPMSVPTTCAQIPWLCLLFILTPINELLFLQTDFCVRLQDLVLPFLRI